MISPSLLFAGYCLGYLSGALSTAAVALMVIVRLGRESSGPFRVSGRKNLSP